MKKKVKTLPIVFLFFAFFMFGSQLMQAQITVYNFTGCWVYFEAREGAPGTCTTCNSSGGWIAPGGGNLTVNNVCSFFPQNWVHVKYGTAPVPNPALIGNAGVTYRPGSGCGVDVSTACGISPTSHAWSVDPFTGQAMVAIF